MRGETPPGSPYTHTREAVCQLPQFRKSSGPPNKYGSSKVEPRGRRGSGWGREEWSDVCAAGVYGIVWKGFLNLRVHGKVKMDGSCGPPCVLSPEEEHAIEDPLIWASNRNLDLEELDY